MRGLDRWRRMVRERHRQRHDHGDQRDPDEGGLYAQTRRWGLAQVRDGHVTCPSLDRAAASHLRIAIAVIRSTHFFGGACAAAGRRHRLGRGHKLPENCCLGPLLLWTREGARIIGNRPDNMRRGR